MAINQEPQNSGSDATGKDSERKVKSEKLLRSDLKSDLPDFSENVLIPVTAQSRMPTTRQSITQVKRPRKPFWQIWQIWGILLVLCSGAIGYSATSMLLKLPKTQSCNKVFWPFASASVRLYCAQSAAEDKELEGLLSAIKLVADLPKDHPLRPEIDRNIDRWATSILELGEAQFQAGKLDTAIATARRIPGNVSAKKLVETKIKQWKSIWSEAEEIYQQVEQKLREADWNGAFTWAVRLTDSSNEYWATTKYEESIDHINIAQEENASITKAQTQVSNGSIDDLLLAIDKADDIKQNSYAYQQAQEVIAQAKEKLVAIVERLIERQEWQELLRVTGRVPKSIKLEKRNRDWQILANAGSSAKLDTVFGMEEAIEEIKKLNKNSEYYQLGQNLQNRWKLETKDIVHLSKARDLARVETIPNLREAIAEAELIPSGNPRYGDARKAIAGWRGQIQTIEDQPILSRARELSYGNNVNAWRRAIAEARLITSNSPLYDEAQQDVRSWQASIQRVEDRPILDQAESFANANNYPAAIASAKRIGSGRSLYSEAQSRIVTWQQEIDGQRYLREATELASQGTPEALARAIRTARQGSTNSSVGFQMVQDINEWSEQILAIARQAADDSLERAIAIARQVPSGTDSYIPAQKEIKIWQIRLNPPQPEAIPPTFKLDKLEKDRQDEEN
ncbi:MAG: chromosome segregation ATPase [Pleurocapsa sp. CRU_1_2]|nr:chromosome segregation ATPase [Pleurocapsa sp. CRU_1_2]